MSHFDTCTLQRKQIGHQTKEVRKQVTGRALHFSAFTFTHRQIIQVLQV